MDSVVALAGTRWVRSAGAAAPSAKPNSAWTAASPANHAAIASAQTVSRPVKAAAMTVAPTVASRAASAANPTVTRASTKEYAMTAPIESTKLEMKRRATKTRSHVLRFTPYAMAKLLFLRDIGPTEVGGFGISGADDLMLVEDIQLVEQVCSAVSVEFDDASVADYFDSQVDMGRKPDQFARIWIHTHPGASPTPSGTDEQTFDRCFGGVDWSVMYILAQEGNSYARARFNVGPGCDRRLRCRTQFDCEFPASDQAAWFEEYCENVSVYDPFQYRSRKDDRAIDVDWWRALPAAIDGWSEAFMGIGQ